MRMAAHKHHHLLVLLPGTDGTGLFYEGLRDHLSDLDTCVLSYPPTGAQSYDRLGQMLLPRLPRDRPYILIAESFAGPLAIWLTIHAPHKPSGLVLAASFAAAPLGWLSGLLSILIPFIRIFPISTWAINHLLFNAKDRQQADRVKAVISPLDRNVVAARVKAALTCDMRGWLGLVTAPVLVLKPMRDRLLPVWLDDHLGAIPEMTRIPLELPHMVFQCDSDGNAARYIRAFIEGQFGKLTGS